MAKYKTKGCNLKAGASNPPTITVAQMGDSTFDTGSRASLLDVTTHDNTSGAFDKIDAGFIEPASLSGELLYDPADTQHEVLRAAHQAGTVLYFLLTLPDAGNATFLWQGRVSEFSIPIPVNGKLVSNIKIDGVGAYTFTA